MIILKVFAPIFLLAIALIKDIWAEQLKHFKHTRPILLGLMVATALISVATTLWDDHEQVQRENSLQTRLSELGAKLDPFIRIALDRYPSLEVQTALARLANDVQQAKEMARPPALQLFSKKVTKVADGYVLNLKFRPDKNVALGSLVFVASLPQDSKAKITHVEPTLEGGAYFSGDDSFRISPDGKSARLIYSVAAGGIPTFEIKVNQPTDITIEGNNGVTPFVIRVQ